MANAEDDNLFLDMGFVKRKREVTSPEEEEHPRKKAKARRQRKKISNLLEQFNKERSQEQEPDVFTVLCPHSHRMKKISRLPKMIKRYDDEYENGFVFCDHDECVCQANYMGALFYHCSKCFYDLCLKCGTNSIAEEVAAKDSPYYRNGTKVKCLYKNGKYYKCTLEKKNGDGKWTVNWKDGDTKDRENHPEAHFKKYVEVAPKQAAAAPSKNSKKKETIMAATKSNEEEKEEKWKLPDDVDTHLFFYLLGFLRDVTGKEHDIKEENVSNYEAYTLKNLREHNKGINVNIFYCTKLEWNKIAPRLSKVVKTLNSYPRSKIENNIRLHVMTNINETVPQDRKNELILLFTPFETFDVESVEALKKNKNIGIIPVIERLGSYFGTWLTENTPTWCGGLRVKYKIIHPTQFFVDDRWKIVEKTLGMVFNNMNEVCIEDEIATSLGKSGVQCIGDAHRIIGYRVCHTDALPPSILQNLCQNLVDAYRETFGLDEYEREPYDSMGLDEVCEEFEPSPMIQNLNQRFDLHHIAHYMWVQDHGTGTFCFFEEMVLDHGIRVWDTIEDDRWFLEAGSDLKDLEEWELQLAFKYNIIEKNENVLRWALPKYRRKYRASIFS